LIGVSFYRDDRVGAIYLLIELLTRLSYYKTL